MGTTQRLYLILLLKWDWKHWKIRVTGNYIKGAPKPAILFLLSFFLFLFLLLLKL
jgi:hypothetical protein